MNIQTEGREDNPSDVRKIYYRYGPTEYSFLEKVFTKYPFNDNDHFADFGCGKGRVLISAAYHKCKFITGYEMDTERYSIALENINKFQSKFDNQSVFSIYNDKVENICIDDTINKFFFYEPFHLKVYMKVLEKIQASLQRNNRRIYLFLYQPLNSTVKYIDSLGYNKVDSNERFLTPNNETHFYQLVVYSNEND